MQRLSPLLDTFAVLLATWITALLGGWVMAIAAQVISQGIFDALDAQRLSPANSQTVPGLIIPPVNSSIVRGIMFIFVGGFFVGLPVALTVEPPLPPVEVTRKNDQGPARGRLVSHSEGFWHLFVGSNSDKALGLRDMPYELLSIPDAEVSVVRIIEAADTSRADAAKVDTEKDK